VQVVGAVTMIMMRFDSACSQNGILSSPLSAAQGTLCDFKCVPARQRYVVLSKFQVDASIRAMLHGENSKTCVKAPTGSATSTCGATVVIYVLLTFMIKVAQGPILDDVLKQRIELEFQVTTLHKGCGRLEPCGVLYKKDAAEKC
jgi:hypothetical protein